MSLRSLFAVLAVCWFLFLAAFYMAPGTAMTFDPTAQDGRYREVLRGTELGLAMTSAVRVIAAGLALVSAAAFEWGPFVAAYRASEARRRTENEAAEAAASVE
jgi:hypothetical protein